MKVHLISIGDELLIGQVVNTNASWMAAELNKNNIDVTKVVTISDGSDDIRQTIATSVNDADVILITGGLGPTKDDITKTTLCEFFHSTLVIHQPSLDNVCNYFKKRGLPCTDINKAQALVPQCCQVFTNEVGTAPTMWFDHNGKIIVSMPGVPFEMKWMMEHHIIPELTKKLGHTAIVHKTILTFGIGESFLSDKIESWELALPPHFKLAYLPEAGKVRLRISAHGNDKTTLLQEVDKEVEKLKTIIGDNIYGFDNETLPSVIGQLLTTRGETIATAESCTGGLISHKIITIPGASQYHKGSIVAYNNDIKRDILNIDNTIIAQHSEVSRQCAIAMAKGVQQLYKTDWAIATTGYSGPDGGNDTNPRGTVWIAVAHHDDVSANRYIFTTTREQHQERSANQALFDAWQKIHKA